MASMAATTADRVGYTVPDLIPLFPGAKLDRLRYLIRSRPEVARFFVTIGSNNRVIATKNVEKLRQVLIEIGELEPPAETPDPPAADPAPSTESLEPAGAA